ncbi:hypothetical protein ACFS5J_02460 [Flavobacterium chuncheonense]|uniref:DUF922 domain-containing protein n=1 Tax=Flavobacterium chuncheonense TaxID=2026653 RepID=A0ABW5YIN0_9FLAO
MSDATEPNLFVIEFHRFILSDETEPCCFLYMKYFYIAFFLYSTLSFSQSIFENDSILLWSSKRKLEWRDFRSNNKVHEYELAQAVITPSLIVIPRRISSTFDLGKLKVAAVVIKDKSWFKKQDVNIMIHEQGHFDIAEIYARKIRKKWTENLLKNELNLDSVFNIYKDIEDEHWNFQQEYEV